MAVSKVGAGNRTRLLLIAGPPLQPNILLLSNFKASLVKGMLKRSADHRQPAGGQGRERSSEHGPRRSDVTGWVPLKIRVGAVQGSRVLSHPPGLGAPSEARKGEREHSQGGEGPLLPRYPGGARPHRKYGCNAR